MSCSPLKGRLYVKFSPRGVLIDASVFYRLHHSQSQNTTAQLFTLYENPVHLVLLPLLHYTLEFGISRGWASLPTRTLVTETPLLQKQCCTDCEPIYAGTFSFFSSNTDYSPIFKVWSSPLKVWTTIISKKRNLFQSAW